jgi:hypothetical protein
MDHLKCSLRQSRGYAVIFVLCLIAAILTHRPITRPPPHPVSYTPPAQTQEPLP